MKLLFLTVLLSASGFAYAEAVYKCTDNGKVSYSNDLGAQRVDTMATRGLDKMSGVQRSGTDVQAEKHNETMERAVKSVIGKSYRRERAIKRQYHSAFDKLQCERLDGQIEALEKEESIIKNKVGGFKPEVQHSSTRVNCTNEHHLPPLTARRAHNAGQS